MPPNGPGKDNNDGNVIQPEFPNWKRDVQPPKGDEAVVTDHFSKDEIQAKFETAEARADTKFAQIIGKIETGSAELRGELHSIGVRLEGLEHSTSGLKATIIGAAIATVGVIIGILAFGQQWFGV